ncbi:hypothetical protein ScPMuIL_001649 [Solemya velum]
MSNQDEPEVKASYESTRHGGDNKKNIEQQSNKPKPFPAGYKQLLFIQWAMRGEEQLLEVIHSISNSTDFDYERRKKLLKLYEDTLNKLAFPDIQPIKAELNHVMPDFEKQLCDQKRKIDGTLRSAILVLGETGAGKSSFINLLLGKDILPCALLSNTCVICEIEYGDRTSFSVFSHNSQSVLEVKTMHDFLSETEFFQDVARVVQDKSNMKVRITLPIDILKAGLLIVDSPGIGDTEEMTDITMNYLVEACAFIYIINSSVAGGVQEDRLLKLMKVVSEKVFKDKCDYHPECMLFICNKWDQVPIYPVNERSTVWNLIKDKVMSHCDCTETQLFKLSTTEASFIQKEGYVVGRFAKVLSEIKKLIPPSREILIENSFRQLLNFIDKAIICCSQHQIQENFPAQKLEIQKRSRENLEQLAREVGNFFNKLEKFVARELTTNTEKLQKYLNHESVMSSLTDFRFEVTQNSWKNTTVSIRAQIFERFEQELNKWETKNEYFRMIGLHVMKEFKNEIPKFDSRINKEEQHLLQNMSYLYNKKVLQHDQKPNMSFSPNDMTVLKNISFQNIESENYNDEETDNFIIPPSIRNRFSSLHLGLKVLLGVSLSPVLLLGMAVMVPMYWKREIQSMIERGLLEEKFNRATNNEDKMKIIAKYAENIKKKLVDPVFLKTVIEQGLQPVLSHIQNEHSKVKKMIDSDLELLQVLEKTVSDNRLLYEPFCVQCETLRRYLLHYQITYLKRHSFEIPKKDVEISDEHVCKGLLSRILQGESIRSEGRFQHCKFSFRKNLIPLAPGNVMKYLEEEKAYRLVNKPFLVRCIGIVKEMTPTSDRPVLYNVLKPVNCSLRQYISEKRSRNQPCNETKLVSDIVEGLEFLHHRNFVHHDLSMDTIAVDNGIIKLTNIMCSKTLPKNFFYLQDKEDIFAFIHFPPEILVSMDTQLYEAVHDMYSVGILMFELAYNKHAYQEEILKLKIETLESFVHYAKQNLPQAGILDQRLDDVSLSKWQCIMKDCFLRRVESRNWPNLEQSYQKLAQVSDILDELHG